LFIEFPLGCVILITVRFRPRASVEVTNQE
jgi:hypothetical protein